MELINLYSVEIAAFVGAVLGWFLKKFFSWAEIYVEKTPNKLDDAIVAKIKEVFKEVLDEKSDQ